MAINLQNTAVNNIKLGTSNVKRVMLGNNLVWPVEKLKYNLSSSLNNCLISDQSNNIKRENPITIVHHNVDVKFILVTRTKFMESILLKADKSWFICQGSEVSTIVEVTDISPQETTFLGVDVYVVQYGATYLGTPNFNDGQKVEFLNPFINYSLVPGDRPLFSPYPTTIGGNSFSYLSPAGVFQKSNGDYVLLFTAIGKNSSNDVYYATSSDLENWSYKQTRLLTGTVPTGNPYKLSNGNILLLSISNHSNGNNKPVYIIMDEDLKIIKNETPINIDGIGSSALSREVLSLIYHNGRYRVFVHDRADNSDINKSTLEYTLATTESDANLMNFLEGKTKHSTKSVVFKASTDKGYLNGKVDDIAYVDDGNDLNILVGSEQESNGWATSNNREYGLAKLSGNTTWVHDVRSPIIVTPIQFFRKYSQLSFWWDHSGRFICPIVKDSWLYVFLSAGSDNPDYHIAGIKIKIK